jgi:hypothetical protein
MYDAVNAPRPSMTVKNTNDHGNLHKTKDQM